MVFLYQAENKIGNIENHIQDLTYWYEYDPNINENYCYYYYEADNSGNAIKLNGEFSDVSTVFNIPSLKVTTLRDGSLSFPEIYIEGVWDPSLYKSIYQLILKKVNYYGCQMSDRKIR